jgi:hypothetical protein
MDIEFPRDNIKINYLRNKNELIHKNNIFDCDFMNFLYLDNSEKTTIYNISYKQNLQLILHPIKIYRMMSYEMRIVYMVYILYDYLQDKNNYTTFIDFIKQLDSDTTILKFYGMLKNEIIYNDKQLIETLKKYINNNINHNSIDNSNYVTNMVKKICVEKQDELVKTMEYYRSKYNKMINDLIITIKKSIIYNINYIPNNLHNKINEMMNRKIIHTYNNKYVSIIYDTFCKHIKQYDFEINVNNTSNNNKSFNNSKIRIDIKNIIKELQNNNDINFHYIKDFVIIVYYFIIYRTNQLYEEYKLMYEYRTNYSIGNKYKNFRKELDLIINCWYDIDTKNESTKYYKIKTYDVNNIRCYVYKTQFIKMINYKNYIASNKIINDEQNLFGTNDIILKDNIDKLSNVDIIKSSFEELELLIHNFNIGFGNIDDFRTVYKMLKNPNPAIQELTEDDVKKYLTTLYNKIKRLHNITQEEYNTFEKRLYDVYGIISKNNKVLEKLHTTMGYNFNEQNELEHKSVDELCNKWLFTYTDIRKNYGNIYYNPNEHQNGDYKNIKEICYEQLGDILFIELIHPKYYYYKYIDKDNNFDKKLIEYYNKNDKLIHNNEQYIIDDKYELKPYQKQGVFGLEGHTLPFRKCHHLYSMGFRYFYKIEDQMDDKLEVLDYYNLMLNKIVNYCKSKRDNLFSSRLVIKKNGFLPWYKMTDDPLFECKFVKELNENKNIIFLGTLYKEFNNSDHSNNSLQLFIFYDKHRNRIRTFNHNMVMIMDNILNPSTFTYMEIHQLCNYLGLYGYMYDNNETDIYFSKYDIFNNDQKYNPDVYFPLTITQFYEVIKELRKKMTRITCFKYPPNKNIPACIDKQKFTNINSKNITTKDILSDSYLYVGHSCLNPQLFIAKYDKNSNNCNITNHTVNIEGAYDIKNKLKYNEQCGGQLNKNLFELKFNTNIQYYIIHKQSVDNYYKILHRIKRNYGANNAINYYFKGYTHDYISNEIHRNWRNSTYDNIIKKYVVNYDLKTHINKIFLLQIKPISTHFSDIYEVLYKYNFNDIMKNNKSRILEISNINIDIEAFIIYSNINDNFNFECKILTPNNYFISYYNNMLEKLQAKYKIKHKDINTYDIVKTKHKYDLIFLAARLNSNYSKSPYWIQNDNKIKIFYLLMAILNLNKGGNIIMPFYIYRSNVQKDIYYLFKQIFKRVELYIPQCAFLFHSSAGYIIGFDYHNIIDEQIICNFMKDLIKVDDDKYIKYDPFFESVNIKELNNDNNKNLTNKWINSFVNLEENSEYDKYLDNYFNEYINKLHIEFTNMWLSIENPHDEIYTKLKTAYTWAVSYGLKLNFSIDILSINNDFETYIINKIIDTKYIIINFNNFYNKYKDKHKNKYIDTNTEINTNTEIDIDCINFIINCDKKYNYVLNYVYNENPTIYNYVQDKIYAYNKLFKYFEFSIQKKYLTEKWFFLYEALLLYELLIDVNNIYIDKSNKIWLLVLKHYKEKIRNITININTKIDNNTNLLLLDGKKNFDKNVNTIIKSKCNAIIRCPFGLLNNIPNIKLLFTILVLYEDIYFHKSETDSKRIYIILKNYNESTRKNIIIVNNIIKLIYNEIIDKLISSELSKLYIINRINIVNKEDNLKKKLKEIKTKAMMRYIDAFISETYQN